MRYLECLDGVPESPENFGVRVNTLKISERDIVDQLAVAIQNSQARHAAGGHLTESNNRLGVLLHRKNGACTVKVSNFGVSNCADSLNILPKEIDEHRLSNHVNNLTVLV